MNTKLSGGIVLAFWGCTGALALLGGCGSDSGSAAINQPGGMRAAAGPAASQPQQVTAPFTPQEAQLLLQQVRTGEKKVADLTPRERFILSAVMQADRERRRKNNG